MTGYGWIDLGNGRQVFRRLGGVIEVARSSLPAPMIMADGMDPVRSMIDGSMHDSRSGYERHVRSNGCEIAGNDPSIMDPKPRTMKPLGGTKESVAEALQKLGA